MNDKRKHDDFSEKVTSSPSGKGEGYQFYVDATPHECIAHLRQLESLSSSGVSFRVILTTVESGARFQVARTESHSNGSSTTSVTGHISHYDIDQERTHIMINAVLYDPVLIVLMLLLGGVGLFVVLAVGSLGCELFLFLGFAIALGFFFAYRFATTRQMMLEIVTNHLILLVKSK